MMLERIVSSKQLCKDKINNIYVQHAKLACVGELYSYCFKLRGSQLDGGKPTQINLSETIDKITSYILVEYLQLNLYVPIQLICK